MATRRSAKVICPGGSFWVTPKQFWLWVRESIIVLKGERPLIGAYEGQPEDFHITLQHTVLDAKCPEHLHAFLQTRRRIRRQG